VPEGKAASEPGPAGNQRAGELLCKRILGIPLPGTTCRPPLLNQRTNGLLPSSKLGAVISDKMGN
jgi:hypothetical protein